MPPTPLSLHQAAEGNNLEAIKRKLLTANLFEKDIHGKLPLHYALEAGHEEAANLLLTIHPREQVLAQHGRALYAAIKGGKKTLVKAVLGHGGDSVERDLEGILSESVANSQDSMHYRPIPYAVEQNKVDIVELLLAHGFHVLSYGEINRRRSGNGVEWLTSCSIAAAHNNVPMLELLTTVLRERLHKEDISQLIEGGDVAFNAVSHNPLHEAARRGHLEAAAYLLDSCNVNIDLEIQGCTALAVAAAAGQTAMVRYLIKKQADVNKGSITHAPLWEAAKTGQTEVMAILLEAGADPDAMGTDTIVGKAIAAGVSLDAIEWMLTRGNMVRPCLADEPVKSGRLDVVQTLIQKHKASITEKNAEGMTAIEAAAHYAQEEIAQWLYQYSKDNHIETGNLMYHALAGHIGLATWLIKQGAAIKVTRHNNTSPLEDNIKHIALIQNNRELALRAETTAPLVRAASLQLAIQIPHADQYIEVANDRHGRLKRILNTYGIPRELMQHPSPLRSFERVNHEILYRLIEAGLTRADFVELAVTYEIAKAAKNLIDPTTGKGINLTRVGRGTLPNETILEILSKCSPGRLRKEAGEDKVATDLSSAAYKVNTSTTTNKEALAEKNLSHETILLLKVLATRESIAKKVVDANSNRTKEEDIMIPIPMLEPIQWKKTPSPLMASATTEEMQQQAKKTTGAAAIA